MQVPGRCSRTAVSHTKSTREGHGSLYNYIYLHCPLGITHMLHYCPENISVHVKKRGGEVGFSCSPHGTAISSFRIKETSNFQVKF